MRIVKDILEVLVVLHSRSYRHNDIKPANVGWSKEQKRYVLNASLIGYFHDSNSYSLFCISWVLFDFDCAEQAKDGEGQIKSVLGTVGFMAPEAEDYTNRSTKSDIYSLGACVIKMCRDYQSMFSLYHSFILDK